jgi:glucose-fructose oxidoreductase
MLHRPLGAFGGLNGGRKLGVALVGLGSYSTGQLGPALRETMHCGLAAVVTGSPEKGRQWTKDYGLREGAVYGYDDMHRLADDPEVDIVYVVTPPGLHAEHTIRAAKAGKHVICEKPMANTAAECDAMIAACREAGVKLSIGYRLHFHPTHRELMRLSRERDFGRLTKLEGGFGFRTGNRGWRLNKALGGGGPLMDVGIYVIQAACMAAGTEPIALTARELPKTRPELFSEVEETIEFDLEFPDGVRCAGRTSYNENYNRFRAESQGGGWIEIEPAYSYRGVRGRTHLGPLPASDVNQQALQMDAFARNILDGTESIVPGEMGQRDMRIIDTIYESARRGGVRLEVPA